MVAPLAWMAPLERLSQNLFISPSSLAQVSALAAFTPESLAVAKDYRHRFREQANFLIPRLCDLGFRLPAKPEGAFYGYFDVSALTTDSYQFCLDLCDQAGVLMAPGRDFGDYQAERYVRVSFTKPLHVLADGVDRISRWLDARSQP